MKLPWDPLPAPSSENFFQALQENLTALALATNPLPISYGTGAPAHTPISGRQMFVRQDGGVGSTLYYYDGAGWTALP